MHGQVTALRHDVHQRPGELQDVALDQRLDYLEQLLHHHGDTLMTHVRWLVIQTTQTGNIVRIGTRRPSKRTETETRCD